MIVARAYRHRLALTEEQEALFARAAGCYRLLYNLTLELSQLQYEVNRHHLVRTPLTYENVTTQLTELKREPGYEWLNEVPVTMLRQSVKDLFTAFQRFFSGQNQYPKFHRRGTNDRFRIVQGALTGLIVQEKRLHHSPCD